MISNDIIESIYHKVELKKLVLRNKNNTILFQEYKNYRNTLKGIKQKAKNSFYTNQIKENIMKKKICEIISDAANGNKNKTRNNLNILDNHNTQFPNDTEMANFCNNYIANIGVNMVSVINESRS